MEAVWKCIAGHWPEEIPCYRQRTISNIPTPSHPRLGGPGRGLRNIEYLPQAAIISVSEGESLRTARNIVMPQVPIVNDDIPS